MAVGVVSISAWLLAAAPVGSSEQGPAVIEWLAWLNMAHFTALLVTVRGYSSRMVSHSHVQITRSFGSLASLAPGAKFRPELDARTCSRGRF